MDYNCKLVVTLTDEHQLDIIILFMAHKTAFGYVPGTPPTHLSIHYQLANRDGAAT